MAYNVSLMGADYPAVPSVVLPQQGGGQADFYSRNGALDPFGGGLEKLQTFYNKSWLLKDTDFPSWAASTTAAAIIPSTDSGLSYVADPVNYEYYIRWRTKIVLAYNAGATLKAIPQKWVASMWYALFRRPGILADFEPDIPTESRQYVVAVATVSSYIFYYNSNGTETMSYSQSYGLYSASTAPVVSNASVANPTLTAQTPPINARCNTTYFATARKGDIDTDNTTIQLVGDLFRCKRVGGQIHAAFRDAAWIINHGANTEQE